jgi:hypothetical protein
MRSSCAGVASPASPASARGVAPCTRLGRGRISRPDAAARPHAALRQRPAKSTSCLAWWGLLGADRANSLSDPAPHSAPAGVLWFPAARDPPGGAGPRSAPVPRRRPPLRAAAAHLRRGERRGLLVLRWHPAHAASPRGRRGVRPHLLAGRRGEPAQAGRDLERAGRHHLRALPARGQGGHLLLHAPGRTGVPAAPRPQPRLRLAAPRHLRHLPRRRGRDQRPAHHRDARLRRGGHGVPQGRVHRVHLGPRRRSGAVPDGRERPERAATDQHTGLRRWRVLQRGLLEDRLASVAPRGQGARGLPATAGGGAGSSHPARASTTGASRTNA